MKTVSWKKGLTKEDHPSIAAMAEKLKGRTKETHVHLAIVAEKLKGRTKETHPYLIAIAEKVSRSLKGHPAWNKGLTKEDHPSIASYAKKRIGKTKENNSGLAIVSGKLKGRTKETHTYIAATAEKLRGRTKEIHPYLISVSKNKIGFLNPAWRGGISAEPYCQVWLDKEYKEDIKERDGYKCMNPDCRSISKRIHLHHIDYIKKNCHPWNLITLCHSCNSRANFNREYWVEFYQKIMSERYSYKYA